MYISNKLINFLNTSSKLSNSTILLTDLEKIVFVASDDNMDFYFGKKISNSLKNILSLYRSEKAIQYMNTTMESITDLISHDCLSRYRSQIILPITELNTNSLLGLLIFFVQDREYLPSNLKFAMTTKHFTEIFCSPLDEQSVNN